MAEYFQDLRHIEAKCGQVPGVDKDVVYIDHNKSVKEFPEHLIQIALEYCR